MIKSKHFA